MTGVLIVLLLGIIAVGQITAGIYLLFGIGWALIGLGLMTLAAAVIGRQGLRS